MTRNGQTHFRPNLTNSATYTATAGTVATGLAAEIWVARVYCTTDAFIAIGASPTATTSDMPISAGVPEYFSLHPGEKVSAVQQSAGGTLYVTGMTQ